MFGSQPLLLNLLLNCQLKNIFLASRPTGTVVAAAAAAAAAAAVDAAPATAAPVLPFRVGHGFDLHRLEEGDYELILGGIKIPHDRGCVAHSDGDALLHTVTDAILGALGRPDIGQLFPDNDPKWKGQTSDVFVKEAVRESFFSRPPSAFGFALFLFSFFLPSPCSPPSLFLFLSLSPSPPPPLPWTNEHNNDQVRLMREAGYSLGNLDCTIILQRPKLSPHKPAIVANLCQILGAHPSVVNVKAKTHEKVDSMGEGRSVAVHAVVLLVKD